MKAVIKWTAISLAVLILLAAVAIYLVFANLNGIVRKGVEFGGTYALGVETTVESVDLKLFEGSIAIDKLKVANPEGFSGEHFMFLEHISVAANLPSLTTDELRVDSLVIEGLDVNLEIRDEKNNYDVILENLQKLSGEGTEETPEEPATTKVLSVGKISITNLTADADIKLGGTQQRTVHVEVPPIELTDFRTDEGQGPVVAQLTSVITRVVLTAIVKQGHELLPAVAIGGIQEGLGAIGDLSAFTLKGVGTVGKAAVEGVLKTGEMAVDGVGKVGEGAVDGVKKVGEGATDGVKKVGEGVGNIGRGIGNLITGKKKEDEQEEGDSKDDSKD